MSNSKTIAIIEDEPSLSSALQDKFELEGFAVHVARNGEEGLEVIQESRPDIVLLDIVMPVMDGLTMLKELRKTEVGKNLPVIILTNLNDASSMSESLSDGARDFLVKSNWKIQEVVDKVKEKLSL